MPRGLQAAEREPAGVPARRRFCRRAVCARWGRLQGCLACPLAFAFDAHPWQRAGGFVGHAVRRLSDAAAAV
eukprot:5440278-Prymnesium_polylepis.1